MSETIPIPDEITKKLAGIGLTVLEHANPKAGVFLATKERMTNYVAVRWIVGSTKLSVLKTMHSTYVEEALTDCKLIQALGEVDGVASVVIVPYLIEIGKAEAFTWEDVLPGVLDTWTTYQLTKEFNDGNAQKTS